MTHNDAGHINNLDATQQERLKQCWLALTEAMCKDASITADAIANSPSGQALFRSVGYDDPDVLILRWLRARKWSVDDAVEQLMQTINWRKQSNIDQTLASGEKQLLDEILTGKSYYIGYDKVGRPVNYIHVREHIRDQFPVELTEQFGVFSVETGRKLLTGTQETGTLVLDMQGFGMHNMDYTLVKYFLQLLERFYPESLGLALIVRAPMIFYSCWAVIKRWVDPVVQQKIHFLKHEEDLLEFIDVSNLPRRLQGSHPNFEYIPPTSDDEEMLTALRADKQGGKDARAKHRRATRTYLKITLQWAHGDRSEHLQEQRRHAREQLRATFEQLVPYVHTRTHYHRSGLIHEPAFDLAYEKLRPRNDSDVVYF